MRSSYTLILTLCTMLAACGRGPIGPQGASGPMGNPGVVGATGAMGASGSSVTPVQLCSTCTPAYPSTFPEYAVCLQGTLYGVYSANGGFLAAISPGTYSSDGINCACTFTVEANCQVTE